MNWRAVRQPKSIEEIILEEERAELLQRIISNLPEMQRRRFLLHYEYEMTYKEIGKNRGLPHTLGGVVLSLPKEKRNKGERIKQYSYR